MLLILPDGGGARYNTSMETITRNVSDIPAGDIPALETLSERRCCLASR